MSQIIQIDSWKAAFLIINSVAAASLNLLIFYFVYRNPSIRTPFNVSILNVCSADILVSINMFISAIVSLSDNGRPVSPEFCWATGFVNLLSFVSSVMGLAAVSFNRYFLVCHWKIYKRVFTKLGTTLYISGAWVFSILISIPPFFNWGKFKYHTGKSICFVDWNSSITYMIFMISICFCGPLFITLVSLYCILRTKRKTTYRLDTNKKESTALDATTLARREERKKQIAKEERKITMSIVIIAVVFCIAWGPFVIIMFVETLGKKTVPGWLDFIVLMFGFLNSTANPIVYMTLNVNYRKEVVRLFAPLFSKETNGDSETKTATLEGTPQMQPRLLRRGDIDERKEKGFNLAK